MDAFYASVEQRDNPALRGQPVIVGAPPTQRGVVCAASSEARKFGVHSAMPSITAKRLCPDGCFVRPRMDAYSEESRRIREIIASTGAVVEQMSVDEAYLDVSSTCQAEDADASLRWALPLARELKTRIRDERLLSATIGIAASKLLATPPGLLSANPPPQQVYGARIARRRKRLASASPMNSALVKSNFKLRCSCSQMSAARQIFMERYMTSALATGLFRDRMQSRKSCT
jgi:DNA polymerase-4